MKITDKDAVEQAKAILKDCSPQARLAIQNLAADMNARPMAPPARSMKLEEVQIIDHPFPKRTPPKIVNESEQTTTATDTSDDEWLNSWVKR